MITMTIAAPTTGEIFFELPLRGESLAAWLNSVFQPGFQFFVDFPISQQRVTGLGGVLVMRRGIEFLSHGVPPLLK